MIRARMVTASAAVAAGVLLLAGCGPVEYHGHNSGIDGVLWRQIAAFEDPLSTQLSQQPVGGPERYLAALDGTHWDGSAATAADIDLGAGGIVLYDLSSTSSSAGVSVFIASGSHPDGASARGPSEVYTCYRVETVYANVPIPAFDRTAFGSCPRPLVGLLADDAAFASAEVFDG